MIIERYVIQIVFLSINNHSTYQTFVKYEPTEIDNALNEAMTNEDQVTSFYVNIYESPLLLVLCLQQYKRIEYNATNNALNEAMEEEELVTAGAFFQKQLKSFKRENTSLDQSGIISLKRENDNRKVCNTNSISKHK